MEKIVVASSSYRLVNGDVKGVNEWLEHGWKVKSVTPAATEGYVTFVFVLEK